MVSTVNNEKCLRCGGCVSVCPQNCINLHEVKGIQIEKRKCTSCSICVKFCPVGALFLKK